MKSESAELVSGLIRQYRRLRLLYLGYLAAAVLALVFFFVDKRVTLALVAASLVYHLVVVRRAGKAYQRAFVHACGQCTLARRLQDARHTEAPTLEEGELRRARLVAATDKPLAVCVQGDRLHVFVTNRILGQKVSSRVPPSAAVAEVDFLPELDGILKASDALV